MIARLSTALAALAALALLAGCGGDKQTIPRDEGSSLIRLLRDARDQAGDPDRCPQLLATVQRIQGRVADLPSSVDGDTRETLVTGVNNLIEDAQSECENAQTTPTETVPTETTPPPTTETTPPPTQPGNGGVTPGEPPEVAPGQGKKGEKPKKEKQRK